MGNRKKETGREIRKAVAPLKGAPKSVRAAAVKSVVAKTAHGKPRKK